LARLLAIKDKYSFERCDDHPSIRSREPHYAETAGGHVHYEIATVIQLHDMGYSGVRSNAQHSIRRRRERHSDVVLRRGNSGPTRVGRCSGLE
jgi:hypothetical protein